MLVVQEALAGQDLRTVKIVEGSVYFWRQLYTELRAHWSHELVTQRSDDGTSLESWRWLHHERQACLLESECVWKQKLNDEPNSSPQKVLTTYI